MGEHERQEGVNVTADALSTVGRLWEHYGCTSTAKMVVSHARVSEKGTNGNPFIPGAKCDSRFCGRGLAPNAPWCQSLPIHGY